MSDFREQLAEHSRRNAMIFASYLNNIVLRQLIDMQTVTQHEIGLLKALLSQTHLPQMTSTQMNNGDTSIGQHYDARILRHNKERLAKILNDLRQIEHQENAFVALEELTVWCDDSRAYHPELRPLIVLCVQVKARSYKVETFDVIFF